MTNVEHAKHIEYPASLNTIFNLLARHVTRPAGEVTEDDVRAEMRRYLTADSPDAKQAMADIAVAVRPIAAYPLDESGTTILVDTDDPTAPDGYGRTYYLTLTEIPR